MSHLSSNSSGVAFLLAPNFLPSILKVQEVVPGRLLHLAVSLDGMPLHFINVYAPSSGTMQAGLLREVNALLGTIDRGECVFLGGDFNCTLEVRDRSGTQCAPAVAKKLRGLIDSFELVDVWRDLHPDSTAFSRRSEGGGSRIDRFYISRAFVSRVSAASMQLVPYSDHCLVRVDFNPACARAGSAYWHFNNRLLEDRCFRESFTRFWVKWRERQRCFSSLRQWWDVGKAHIRLFCKEYTWGSTGRRDSAVEKLEREIQDAESRLGQFGEDSSEWGEFQRKKEVLRSLLLERSRGAYVRSRVQMLHELDRASPFFFSLEKGRGARKQLVELLADDGSSVTDPERINALVRSFYGSLFSAEGFSVEAQQDLWEGLPTVDRGEADLLDGPLSLEELTRALHQLRRGKSPGLDGLTVEFVRAFWDVLGGDYMLVLGRAWRLSDASLVA